MIVDAIRASKAEGIRLRPHTMIKSNILYQFVTVARQMDMMGYLRDIPFSLAHLDLAARNVMIRETSKPGKPIITAILD